MTSPTGIEALVCQDIAERQALGKKKYGTTVAENPLPLHEWLKHAYEENLDAAIYLRRAMEQQEKNQQSLRFTLQTLELFGDALRTAGAPDSGDPVELMEWAEMVRKRSEPRFALFTSHEFYPDTSTVKLCGIFEHVNDALIKGRSEKWYEVIDAKTLEVVEDSFDNVKLPLTDETGTQP